VKSGLKKSKSTAEVSPFPLIAFGTPKAEKEIVKPRVTINDDVQILN
jgi:hypothetical protein